MPFSHILNRSLIFLFSVLVATSASSAEKLTIFSGRSDKFVKPVIKAFTDTTGIEVVIHAGKSTGLLNKLKLEAGRTEADLYISNDAGNLQKGVEFGLFQALPGDLLAPIPANYRDPKNNWVGISARARVLVVNKKAFSKDNIPTSIFDLAEPRFKDKLAITHSSNESFIAGTTVYMQLAGKQKTKQWLLGMKKNVAGKVYNKHSKIVKAVASGKKSIGLVNHYYIYRFLAKHPDAPIKIVLPDQSSEGMGIAWNVAGIAISKFSKHSEAAKKLIKFLISAEGQKIFANVNNEYPTRKGVATAAAIPPLATMKIADVGMVQLGVLRNQTIDLIESVGMP
ncbi:MAG: ABC transporter substrate-binding protein [Thiohalomonadales bacterium]